MSNQLRDPHDPVIPGEHVHPPEGHGGMSMSIGVSGDRTDPHEPVLPEGMGAFGVPHVEDHPSQTLDTPIGQMLDITEKVKAETLQPQVAPQADPNDIAHHIKDAQISILQRQLQEANERLAAMGSQTQSTDSESVRGENGPLE